MINGIKPEYPPYMDNKDKYSKAMSLFMGRIDEKYGEYYEKTLTALKYEPIRVNRGRRFDKLIQGGSVYCFVEKNTGNVYKAASWKAPAKIVRFDLRLIGDREFLFNPNNISWAGSHLYLR